MQRSIIYPEVKFRDVAWVFWKGIKPQRGWVYFLIFSVAAANVVGVIIPLFYKQFFDVITISGDKILVARELLVIVFYVAFLNFLSWLFYRLATVANVKYQITTMARLKQQSYDYLMRHSYSFFANNFVGSLVQKINRFARSFERLSDNLVWNLLPLFVKLVSIFIVVSLINIWIAVVILVWAMCFLMFNVIFSNWKLKYDIKVAEIDSKATGYLADTLTNQNTITAFSSTEYESVGYKKVTNEQAKLAKFTWGLDATIEAGQHFLGVIIEFALFFFALRYWEKGLVTVGVFVLLQVYIIDLIHQLWGFTRIVRDTYQSYADAKELVEITLLSHEIKDAPGAEKLKVSRGEVEFRNLSFSFSGTREVLSNVNLTIKPGEKVALVGPSGAGKTTFTRLLLRLYSPTEGEILVDGQDIAKATQNSLRNNIAMVPQDTVLFHRTLAENIGYGKHGASKEEIEKVAALAHCDEFIKDLPQGFETYVGERGVKLSGGERQRVAIARAILKNAPILILDEATSSLDSRSEALIQDALNVLMKEKTTIVIAHRLSTIQKMDRIIVIDNGKIIEEGSHNVLLEKVDSLYRKLWTLQAGGFLPDAGTEEESEKEEAEEMIEESEEPDVDSKTPKTDFTGFRK